MKYIKKQKPKHDAICYGCGAKFSVSAEKCPSCGRSFAVTENELLTFGDDSVICNNCGHLFQCVDYSGEICCPSCGIIIAFPSERDICEKIEKINLLYSDKRMQYLAFHGMEAFAEKIFRVKIYCVYTDEHFTITLKGLDTSDNAISYLFKSGYLNTSTDLPYFSNWPTVKDVISKKVFKQYSRLVCELDDIEYVLRNQKMECLGNGCLCGCPSVSLPDRVSLSKTTEIIDYEEL